MSNLNMTNPKEYAWDMIEKNKNQLKEGVCRNFLFFFSRRMALFQIEEQINAIDGLMGNCLSKGPALKFLEEVKLELFEIKSCYR